MATSAHAQVIAGNLTTPIAAAFGAGVTVVGSGAGQGILQAAPFALPVFGTPKTIQFTTAGDIFQFNNLPASGNGIVTGLNTIVNFTVSPGAVAIGPLNFSTEYSYDADITILGQDGTRVTYNPTGAPTFSFGGSIYRVDLNATQASSQGTPTSLSNSTITGSITNLTSTAAPEPATLAFLMLGGTFVMLRRRKQ
ncbi:PEP-CTERM sorting domain-containing protein [Armatimonas rosea]|uniref:PEP-CTERM protein-sorting domain-containing protein n=1 Tax=Armatimonas rosea TaxID=685828 RepID=A0A7W9SRD1_ARMRO|nr:PEP-CTERM sorting domain-containing protein [Armatimonas rosea]MBB6050799.1 hypothetical protein [Armatimonas rosea]